MGSIADNPSVRSGPIYLDYQATTPLDPRVLEAMLPWFSGKVGNPHSTSNTHGTDAREAVELARSELAALIGAEAREIVFTSGATESNNMLIRGAMSAGLRTGRDGLLTVTTEHKAVLDVAKRLQRKHRLHIASVESGGLIDLAEIERLLDDRTALVTIMAANNEIGTLQPVAEVAHLAERVGALFHSDAAQAIGKIPIDVRRMRVHLMSFSAHKLYGPMGIGAAYIAREVRRRIDPLLHGGSQEGGMRSGTLPVALCVGFGAACRIARLELEAEAQRLTQQRDLFLAILRDRSISFAINGVLTPRLPGNLNLSFPNIDSEALIMRVRSTLSIASGSACTAESLEPSHVILALGHGIERAEEAVRIGFGRQTSEREVVEAAHTLASAVADLSRLVYKPPIEMVGL